MKKYLGDRLTAIAAAMLCYCLTAGSTSMAVGFGDVTVYSYLNEPLSAEIELQDVEGVDADFLIAELAEPKDFMRAGIARPFFLTKFKFEIINVDGRSFIYISSTQPMKSPYIDLLIALSWPEGRLVKGYTMLVNAVPYDQAKHRQLPLSQSLLVAALEPEPEPVPEPAPAPVPEVVAVPTPPVPVSKAEVATPPSVVPPAFSNVVNFKELLLLIVGLSCLVTMLLLSIMKIFKIIKLRRRQPTLRTVTNDLATLKKSTMSKPPPAAHKKVFKEKLDIYGFEKDIANNNTRARAADDLNSGRDELYNNDLLLDEEELAIKLELAQNYLNVGDKYTAKLVLQEVLENSNDIDKTEQAQELLRACQT